RALLHTLFPYTTLFRSARVLAGGADRDVNEIRSEIREFRQATVASFNAMREDHIDLRNQMNSGFAEMNNRFAEVDNAFLEVRGRDRKSTRLNSSHQIIS